jgi:hypothetical protein
MGSAVEVEQQEKAVASTLLRLRATQFQLERVQARLFQLKRIHDQGFGRGTLPGGMTTARFFNQLQGERNVTDSHMATVRNMARLYAVRNGGQDPTSRAQMLRQKTVRQERPQSPQKVPSLERPAHLPKAPAKPKRPAKELPVKKKLPGKPDQGTAP